jgi:hypothetical protein
MLASVEQAHVLVVDSGDDPVTHPRAIVGAVNFTLIVQDKVGKGKYFVVVKLFLSWIVL